MPEQLIRTTGKFEEENSKDGSNLPNINFLKIGGGSEVFYADREGTRYGNTDFDLANAWIKNNGTYKFKDADGNTLFDISGMTFSAVDTIPSIQGWSSTILFTALDYNTISWSLGTIILANGTTYTINTGDTGNITLPTYIYLDVSVSLTALQVTTTASLSVGANKILVAVAFPNTDTNSKATFQAFGGRGGVNLAVDNIVANSASVNEFISNSAQIKDAIVTNAKIVTCSIEKLLAGAITSKIITLGVTDGQGDSYIASGKTDFNNTQSGFIIGVDDSDSNKAKFYIGDSNNYFNWDGSNIALKGSVTITGGSGIANLNDAGNLATLDNVGASNCDTTIISGGKVITTLLTADNIQTGTLIGRTVKAVGGSSGIDTWIQNDGTLAFTYNGSIGSMVYANTSNQLNLWSANNTYIMCDELNFDYNNDNDGSDCWWNSYTSPRMKLTSAGVLKVDGSVDQNAWDFAEMFEATEEFSKEKIPNGTSVVLENGKIRPANKNEEPFGVISATSGFIGDSGGEDAGTKWSKKYLRDEFGEYLKEKAEWWSIKHLEVKKIQKILGTKEIGGKCGGWVDSGIDVPKEAKITLKERKVLNPNFDENMEYVERKERPEWNIVGLLGKVAIRKDQPKSKSWLKMKDISDSIELWLIK